jgi:flagellar motor switch protein FliG
MRPYYKTLLVLVSLVVFVAVQTQTDPLERALGISHGQLIETSQQRFYVFDHVSDESAEQLTVSVQSVQGESSQAIRVWGYGVWRVGFLALLCYGMVLVSTRALLDLSYQKLVSSRLAVDKRYVTLAAVLLGVGSGLQGLPDWAPYLFGAVYLTLLVTLAKAKPNSDSVARGLELLDLSRALWCGWIVTKVFGALPYGPTLEEVLLSPLGVGLGVVSASIGTRRTAWSDIESTGDRLMGACRNSFDVGCYESQMVVAVLFLSVMAHGSPHLGVLLGLGVFGWGRFAQSVLLRAILKAHPALVDGGRSSSRMRIASGVWFLLPLPFSALFLMGGTTALMIWLSGLVPLVILGRPWGSTYRAREHEFPEVRSRHFRYVADLYPELRNLPSWLTGKKVAAILFMSLPPEASAQLFSELGPEEVQSVTLEITQLPSVDPRLREVLCQHFYFKMFGEVAEDVFSQLQNTTLHDPERAAAILKSEYLKDGSDWLSLDSPSSPFEQIISHPPKETFRPVRLASSPAPAEELLEASPGLILVQHELTGPQAAAVVMMSLPPEHSAALFSRLEPHQVEAITLEITKLPTIERWVREAVCQHFFFKMRGRIVRIASLDFENAVSTDYLGASDVLKDHHLGQNKDWLQLDLKVTIGGAQEAAKLSLRQKSAVFLMALPPETSAELFKRLGPEETQAITVEISRLPSISRDVRLAVLVEAMTSSWFWLRKPSGRRKRIHICKECGDTFAHGIGLRKHQRRLGHKGSSAIQHGDPEGDDS